MFLSTRIPGITIAVLTTLVAFAALGTGVNATHHRSTGRNNEAGLIWDSTPTTTTA